MKVLNNATWNLSQSYNDVQISSDAKSMTTRLPPSTSIDSNFAGQFGRIKLHFSSGSSYPEYRFVVPGVSPLGVYFTCAPPSSSSGWYVNCRANVNWLRTLTQPTTVRIEVFQNNGGGQKQSVHWTFEPAPPGQVFIDRLTGPGSVPMGNLAQFSIRLDQPAPAGGLDIDWKIDPANCFEGLKGNVRYNPGSFNTMRVEAGQQYKNFALGTTSCAYTSGKLHTWVHQTVDQTPYYKTVTFTLSKPRG